jgi:hypothetical protein
MVRADRTRNIVASTIARDPGFEYFFKNKFTSVCHTNEKQKKRQKTKPNNITQENQTKIDRSSMNCVQFVPLRRACSAGPSCASQRLRGGGGKVAFVVDEMSTSIIEKQTSIIKPTNGRRTLYDTIRTALHQRGKLLLSIAMLLALCCTSEIEK